MFPLYLNKLGQIVLVKMINVNQPLREYGLTISLIFTIPL